MSAENTLLSYLAPSHLPRERRNSCHDSSVEGVSCHPDDSGKHSACSTVHAEKQSRFIHESPQANRALTSERIRALPGGHISQCEPDCHREHIISHRDAATKSFTPGSESQITSSTEDTTYMQDPRIEGALSPRTPNLSGMQQDAAEESVNADVASRRCTNDGCDSECPHQLLLQSYEDASDGKLSQQSCLKIPRMSQAVQTLYCAMPTPADLPEQASDQRVRNEGSAPLSRVHSVSRLSPWARVARKCFPRRAATRRPRDHAESAPNGSFSVEEDPSAPTMPPSAPSLCNIARPPASSSKLQVPEQPMPDGFGLVHNRVIEHYYQTGPAVGKGKQIFPATAPQLWPAGNAGRIGGESLNHRFRFLVTVPCG